MTIEYRQVEYAVVKGIGRNVWKWSTSVAGIAHTSHEYSRAAAIAAAERTIDKALGVKKVRLVPPEK